MFGVQLRCSVREPPIAFGAQLHELCFAGEQGPPEVMAQGWE